MLKPIFVSSLVRAQIVGVWDGWNLTLHERGDMYIFINVLQVVLRCLDDGPSSLHIHRDVRHFVDVLHPRYFDRLLCASDGGNLSLICQISSFLRVLRVLFGFKPLFLSPSILVRLVTGVNLARVSNFKLSSPTMDESVDP